jgi:hypothetical protein
MKIVMSMLNCRCREHLIVYAFLTLASRLALIALLSLYVPAQVGDIFYY